MRPNAAQQLAGQFNLNLQDIRLATELAAQAPATEPLADASGCMPELTNPS